MTKNKSLERYAAIPDVDFVARGDDGTHLSVRRYTMTRDSRDNWIAENYRNAKKINLKKQKKSSASEAEDLERRKKGTAVLIGILIAAALLLAWPLIKLCLSHLELNEVLVEGSVPYSSEQLLAASGYEMGGKLFAVRSSKAEKKVLEELSYIDTCRITVKLPDKITFTVSASDAVIYTEIAGDYYALSSGLKVLERSDNGKIFKAAGLISCELPKTQSAVVGSEIELADGADSGYIKNFLSQLQVSELRGRTSAIDLGQKYDIVMDIDGKYSVRFGSPSDVSLKMLTAARITEENAEGGNVGKFVIDVSDPGRACVSAG